MAQNLLNHTVIYPVGHYVFNPSASLVAVVATNNGVEKHEVIYRCTDDESKEHFFKHSEIQTANSAQIRVFNEKLLHAHAALPEAVPTEYHKSILLEAENLVHGARNRDYGHPLDDFTKTAALWSVIADTELNVQQVALMMIALKVSRQMNLPKRDNLVDIAGYAETAMMCVDEQDKRSDQMTSFGAGGGTQAATCIHGKGMTDYCEPCGRIHNDN